MPMIKISDQSLEEYLDILRLSGVTEKHIKEVHRALKNYQKYILFQLDYKKSIEYFNKLQQEFSVAYYKKQMYQIKKFLKHLKVDWVEGIKLPQNPVYTPARITQKDINKVLNYFKDTPHFLQIRALVLLGVSSGLRAEEIYQLNPPDIDIENRIVYVNHNPSIGQTTKTQRSRISFFNKEAQEALRNYLNYFNNGSNLKTLFSQTHITHQFRDAPIKTKQLRKYFSQEWTRRNGNSSVKKLLMGHSLRGDTDMAHYNYQSEEDLKRVYDNVMANHNIECRKHS